MRRLKRDVLSQLPARAVCQSKRRVDGVWPASTPRRRRRGSTATRERTERLRQAQPTVGHRAIDTPSPRENRDRPSTRHNTRHKTKQQKHTGKRRQLVAVEAVDKSARRVEEGLFATRRRLSSHRKCVERDAWEKRGEKQVAWATLAEVRPRQGFKCGRLRSGSATKPGNENTRVRAP